MKHPKVENVLRVSDTFRFLSFMFPKAVVDMGESEIPVFEEEYAVSKTCEIGHLNIVSGDPDDAERTVKVIHPCGTPGCHGGWYAIGKGVRSRTSGYSDFSDG